ncbi:hypothetical protein CC86DRAFT_408724 [Ophiobolus disseminans]|uniref:Uncharacterized protein n=1 Tax=Ophiobolus disseminans TaxID=1469910 RepID=A0A6A6ZS86_9PLEO|nr:hypothetical protein CC86DRAFT_408724 [Ophiobolus disseminans]
MASQPIDALFCPDIGNVSTSNFHCCSASKQNSSLCREIFNNPNVFTNGCGHDCLANCSRVDYIYGSILQDTGLEGNGVAPIRRYLTCANVPNIAGYLDQNTLEPSIVSTVEKYIPRDAPLDARKNVTLAVTDCLTATCRNARQPAFCNYQCAGINLLTNGTTPNMAGLNECLRELCTGQQRSLPFADADVVGIGVFASYIMQCMFVVVLWFIFIGFQFSTHRQRKATTGSEHTPTNSEVEIVETEAEETRQSLPTHQMMFEEFLEQFHKAQCYFSATIQIAALTYGIFDVDMLTTFMLVPLATNGVLPVVFTLLLLYKCNHKSGLDIVLLTAVVWLLSSIVYWTLYSHIIPINTKDITAEEEFRAYRQFYYKLSSLDACGGYSALAVCPNNFKLGQGSITRESHKIRVLTPIIWTFSTLCLLAILAAKLSGTRLSELRPFGNKTDAKYQAVDRPDSTELGTLERNGAKTSVRNAEAAQSTASSSDQHNSRHYSVIHNTIYVFATLCFLAGIGMQLSLLSIATSLDMMDRKDWSFGQVVAITIWIPPLLAYLYQEIEVTMRKAKRRREKKKAMLQGQRKTNATSCT